MVVLKEEGPIQGALGDMNTHHHVSTDSLVIGHLHQTVKYFRKVSGISLVLAGCRHPGGTPSSGSSAWDVNCGTPAPSPWSAPQ